MSLSETLMLMTLGFALALVVILLIGRALWSMAIRLGARRHAKNIPTAMLELQADRDRLRAEHAMMSRKLELRLEDIKTRMTEQMAEVSRHRNRVQSMMTDLERRDETLKIRDREIAALNAQLEIYKTDLAACTDGINKLSIDASKKDMELANQATLIAQLSASNREKSSLVSNLGSELETVLRLNNKGNVKADTSEGRLLQRIAELTSISSQMSNQRDNISLAVNATASADTSVEVASSNSNIRRSNLDEKLADTERDAQAMADQLKAIDQMMNPPEPEQVQSKKSGAMANVISLAQRIRALQKAND